jgi:hypothetical protein
MKKDVFLVFIASAIIAITAGCNKNNGGGGNGEPAKKMIPSEIKYIYDNGDYDYRYLYKFYYDYKRRIAKVEEYYRDELWEVQNYIYDVSGKLIRIDSPGECGDVFSITFSYSGNFVTVSIPSWSEFIKFELQNDRIFKSYDSEEGAGELVMTFFYDSRGNVTKIINYHGDQLLISYEHKRGVFSGVNMPNWFFMFFSMMQFEDFMFQMANNPSSIKEVYDKWTFLTTYHYEEYEFNYPTKMKITESDIPLKKNMILPYLSKKKSHSNSNLGRGNNSHYEIKYI